MCKSNCQSNGPTFRSHRPLRAETSPERTPLTHQVTNYLGTVCLVSVSAEECELRGHRDLGLPLTGVPWLPAQCLACHAEARSVFPCLLACIRTHEFLAWVTPPRRPETRASLPMSHTADHFQVLSGSLA